MRSKLVSVFLIILFFGTNCKKDLEYSSKSYPVIITKDVEIITDTGIIASAEITENIEKVVSYGFIWNKNKNNLSIENSSKIQFNITPNTIVEEPVTNSLYPGTTYFLKAFAKTNDYLIYGNIVKFISKGVKPPIISSISSEYGIVGDKITIAGNYFSNDKNNIIVKIGSKEINIDSCSLTKIYITIPQIEKGTYDLNIGAFKKNTSTKFNILSNWTKIANFPGEARYNTVAFTLNGYGYVGTGSKYSIYYNDFWKYSPESNTWTQIADFPGERSEAVSFVLNGYAYVGMGYSYKSSYNDLWKYNSDTDSWTQISNFPGTIYNKLAFVIDNNAYIYGRYDFWKYNTATDTWIQIADLPFYSSSNPVALTLDKNAYVGGYENTFWKFNQNSNTWTQISDCPGKVKSHLTAFALENNVYIGTGSSYSTYYNDFWKYETETNTWTQIENFSGGERSKAVAFSINKKAYMGMGYYYKDGSFFYNDFWEFNPNPVP